MTSRRRRISPVAVAIGAVLLLGACASNAPQDTFQPEGPAAREIQNLVNPVFFIAAVVFVLVEVGVLFLVWRFRQRPEDNDDELPPQVHGHVALELGWTILPALILTVVGVMTVTTIFRLDSRRDDAEMTVEVIGHQWWWEYHYWVDGSREQGEEPDIITANDLVIPAGTSVELSITSADVIHSFWIPRLNGKMDAVPGRYHPLMIEADEPGTFIGQCTEFCGLSHGYMHQRVVALEQGEFEDWLQHMTQPAEMPTDEAAARGAETFTTMCSSCHLVDGINNAEFEEQGNGLEDLVAGPAPNLTHLMTRGVFAGGVFDLWETDEVTPQWEDIGEGGTVNESALKAWIQDAPGHKPMSPDDGRGMPAFDLPQDQVDDLYEFLTSLE
jgi:cytochrome c oxidase subunit II